MNKNTKSSNSTVNCGCGCFSTIISILIIWALIFGITIDGKYYGVSCSCSKGVDISSP